MTHKESWGVLVRLGVSSGIFRRPGVIRLTVVSVPVLFPEPSIQSKVEEVNVIKVTKMSSLEKTILCTD